MPLFGFDQWLSFFRVLLIFITLLKPSSPFSPISTRKFERGIILVMRAAKSEENSKSCLMKPHEALGVIFDIDGTLADSWKLGFDATQVVLEKRQIPLITEELYHECTRYCTPDRLARHAGLIPDRDTNFSKVGQELADEFDDLYVGLVSTETAGFYDGIEGLILALSSHQSKNGEKKIAALTNACVAYAHAVLKTNCPSLARGIDGKGIYESFLSIHGADTVKRPKPHPDGLLQCCEEINLPPDQCVYIGDSPSDAVAAKASGMIAVGVLWGSHPFESLKKAPFDYLVEDVNELRNLLLKNC